MICLPNPGARKAKAGNPRGLETASTAPWYRSALQFFEYPEQNWNITGRNAIVDNRGIARLAAPASV
jgi:hypothetical protein